VTDRHLLAAERQKRGEEGYFFPAVVGVLNLVVCSYCESAIRREATALALFLFFESAIVIALSAAQLFTTSIDILSKTRIFPVTPRARLRFAIVADLRRPVVLAVIGSAAFFLIILFRHNTLQAIAAPVVFIMSAVVTEALFVTFMLIMTRRAVPVGGIVALIGMAVAATFFAVMIFHVDLTLNPLLIWITGCINAAGRGDGIDAFRNFAFLLATGICAILIGRRYA
jgi:hypothetical protein